MGAVYDNAIQALYEHGITAGTTADCTASSTCNTGGSDFRFCPLDPASRSQLAVFVWRADHRSSTCPSCPSSRYFCDSNSAGSACGCIEGLHDDGVVEGGMSSCSASSCTGLQYCPLDTALRLHAMVMLAKATGATLPCMP